MDATQVVTPENCGFSCQFEWIEVSSNFFSVSVYTPALIAGLIGYGIYRLIQKKKAK
jgi:uncharacterized membrane protein